MGHLDSSYALWTIIAVGVWKTFGYFMLVYLAALQAMPQAVVLEAARLDGARPWDRFWSITWPLLLRPTTWFATVIALILSFQAFDFFNIMTQGGPSNATYLLVFYIYQHGFQYFRLGYGRERRRHVRLGVRNFCARQLLVQSMMQQGRTAPRSTSPCWHWPRSSPCRCIGCW